MRPREIELLSVSRYKITEIDFGILSPEMIKKMAVAKITNPSLYDIDGYPVEGGIMDPRLGVVDPGLRCRTCGGKVDTCLGHFGYLELARPVIHTKFSEVIYHILRAICLECSRVTIKEKDKEEILKKAEEIGKKYGERVKWEFLEKVGKRAIGIKECPYCGAKKKEIVFKKPYEFYIRNEETGELERIWPDKIREILEKIPNSDLPLLGINPDVARPEWLILTVLPIPPITVRPSITLESGLRSEDDLTHALSSIVRINERLLENIMSGAPMTLIEKLWDTLQLNIATYFDNSPGQGILPATHRGTNRPLKTLVERIKGKEGRIRCNLLGKRVNFSARAVITPDPKIKINEVGVPLEVAMILTVPERITEWNKERLLQYIKNGPNKYPGANYVISPDGVRRRITEETKEYILQIIDIGWIVERHLQNGDYVLFNRQPSLHRMSVMAHRVKILPGKVFRIHPAAAPPYNADFDGDEMNLHVPQSLEALSELKYLMDVKYHYITPRYGLPIIGAKQDFITGLFLLTHKEVLLSRKDVMDILGYAGIFVDKLPKPAKIINGKPYWTGKQIFSMLLPKDLNYEGFATCAVDRTKKGPDEPNDGYVIIKNGELICGTIDKATVSAEKGKLLRKIHEMYGPDFAMEFLYKICMLGLAALMKIGLSVTFDDLQLPEDVIKIKKETVKKAMQEVDKILEDYENGRITPLPGKSLEETVDQLTSTVLNKSRKEVADLIARKLKLERNNLGAMILSGARGKITHLVLMLAMLGPQSVGGSPIKRGYYKRTLPHFKEGTLDPRAFGFISGSYKDGLSPIEYFLHSIASRRNIAEKTKGTPRTGYFYRRMVHNFYDLTIHYDYTVRDSKGVIVQFKYGEDGLDVTKTFNGKYDLDFVLDKILDKLRLKDKIKKKK